MYLDIVIVNWNSGDFLKNCLNSLNQYGLNEIQKVIVIDNNSFDDSHKLEEEYHFNLEIVINKKMLVLDQVVIKVLRFVLLHLYYF